MIPTLAYLLFVLLSSALMAAGCLIPAALMAGLALMVFMRPHSLHRRQRPRHATPAHG